MDTWTSSSAAAAWWTSSARGISEVLIDQVFWNPCFSVMFFGYIGLLEMKGLRNVASKFRNEFVTSVTGSWTVWPLAHLVNFRFVPVGSAGTLHQLDPDWLQLLPLDNCQPRRQRGEEDGVTDSANG
jgi:hypothetical protein